MKKLLIWIIIIIVIGATLFFVKKHKLKAKQNGYQTVQVEYGDIEVKVLSTGTIKPYTRVEVKAPVNGTIDKVVVVEGNKVKSGATLAWMSSEERINLISSAQSNLTEAQKSGDENLIEEAKAAYDIAQRAYKPVPILTSMSGEVIKRDCEPGQNVTTQTTLFVISDRLVAGVEVDEADIGSISIGQKATIVLDAFPDEIFIGKVSKISHESRTVSNVTIYDVMVVPDTTLASHEAEKAPQFAERPRKRNRQVDTKSENQGTTGKMQEINKETKIKTLKPPISTSISQNMQKWTSGMTANVEFLLQSKYHVLLIPSSVIKERKRAKFVTVLENGKPAQKEIQTGISDGTNTEIVNGLTEGEEVFLKSDASTSFGGGSSSQRMMRTVGRMRR